MKNNRKVIPSWHALVDYIKIMPDKNIVFHLRNGCEEIVPLAEVQENRGVAALLPQGPY